MDPDRWSRIEALVADALEADPSERAALVRRWCADDPVVLAEVQALLDAHVTDPEFLAAPLIDRARIDAAQGDAPPPGGLGPWTAERLLGRGGMGEVWLATQLADGITRRVALKVVRRGMDSEDAIRRFRLERRILAQLNHPGIAQLIDAGLTADGRPWFAMEYVDGVPLDAWSREEPADVRRRIALFLQVCDAVSFAHRHLVVHRDLKPRNILVDRAGVARLVDFGIGKILDDTGSFGTAVETRTEVRLLTPEYAAPEQVRGGAITTATDVYSLGVILYELLTGAHPYARRGASASELAEATTGAMPASPSACVRASDTWSSPAVRAAVARALTGDLDTIVLMALRKEPDRRYATAADLAADLRRYLDGHPVAARADTLGYRIRKFVGRNRLAVLAGAVSVIALLGAMANTMVQSRRVARAAARAEAERDKALEVRGFLMEMFGATGADQGVGDTVTVRALLDRQRASLGAGYVGREEVKADLLEVLADGYDRLGLHAEAEPAAREALDLRHRLLPPTHPDVAASLNLLGWIIHQRGRSQEAEALVREAVQVRRADSARTVEGLARSLNDLGVIYNALQRHADAAQVLREALALRRVFHGDRHRAVGITANNLAAAFYFMQQLDSAVATQALALSALQAAVGEDHQRTIVALSNLATFKRAGGDLTGAEEDFRALLARQARLQGRDHPVTARVMNSLAGVLAERGTRDGEAAQLVEAEALHQEALAALELRLGPTHPQVAVTLDRLAAVAHVRGRPGEAVALQERALAVLMATTPDTTAQARAFTRRLREYRTPGVAPGRSR